MSTTESELRKKLRAVSTGQLPLRDFEVWFAPLSLQAEEDGTESLWDLVWETELKLAEYERGHRTHDDLRAQFGSIATMGLAERRRGRPAKARS